MSLLEFGDRVIEKKTGSLGTVVQTRHCEVDVRFDAEITARALAGCELELEASVSIALEELCKTYDLDFGRRFAEIAKARAVVELAAIHRARAAEKKVMLRRKAEGKRVLIEVREEDFWSTLRGRSTGMMESFDD